MDENGLSLGKVGYLNECLPRREDYVGDGRRMDVVKRLIDKSFKHHTKLEVAILFK